LNANHTKYPNLPSGPAPSSAHRKVTEIHFSGKEKVLTAAITSH